MSININDFQREFSIKAKLARIPGMEWEDILQELNLQLLLAKDKYNPLKSQPQTFVSRIATNKIRDLARRSMAKKRDSRRTISLDALIEDGFDISYDQYGKTILQNN
jgi:RNA polymerase sigma factor (sigma-70 family)